MNEERAAVLRVLDANRNRCVEALRVVEEHARLVQEAPLRARALRALRHALQDCLARELPELARDGLLARDTASDPGRPAAGGPLEGRRDLEDLLGANLSRAKESLRVLEEYAKLLAPAAARELSRLRFALYDLEAAARAAGPRGLAERGVYLLLGEAPGRPSLREQARAGLEGGVRLFQLRAKGTTDRSALAAARALVELLAPEDAWLLVNDRPDVARLAGARGVHLGRDDLPPGEARRIVGPGRLVGASAHDEAELTAALAEGADHVGFGTLFASPTRPDLPARGLELLARLATGCPVPLYGIGGISADRAALVIAAGATGVAVSSAVLDAPDPARAAHELVTAVAAARARRAP